MMRFPTLLRNPADWMLGRGDFPQVVISSRIRLARNLMDSSFPGRANPDERRRTLDRILPVIEDLAPMRDGFSRPLDELGSVEKKVLVERHLISREQAGNASGSGVVINRAQTLSIMVNEEDHLRIQALLPGLQPEDAARLAFEADDALSTAGKYAFDPLFGYLTSCPTNTGTGMRASAMLHLPALTKLLMGVSCPTLLVGPTVCIHHAELAVLTRDTPELFVAEEVLSAHQLLIQRGLI